jgi:hypothetical protein
MAVLAICWLLRCSGFSTAVACATAVACSWIGWRFPATVKPVYVALSLLALPCGLLVSEAVMLIVYFGLLTPLGLVFRLRGRDALQRTIDPAAPTYWHTRPAPRGPRSYLRRW